MRTIDDVRNVMRDFIRRLENNGAEPEKVRLAVAKVGRLMALQVLERRLHGPPKRCTACAIHEEEPEYHQAFGSGNPSAEVALIGQGLGATEGEYGLPFVGIAGTLLTMMLEDAGLPRETVYLDNIVKCRPKDNRAPAREEAMKCMELYLADQLMVIRPRVIVALGAAAVRALAKDPTSVPGGITKMRGSWFTAAVRGMEFPAIATYHPAYVVRKHGEDFQKTYAEMVADLRAAAEKVAQLKVAREAAIYVALRNRAAG